MQPTLPRFLALPSFATLSFVVLSAACSSTDAGTTDDDLTSAPIPPAALLDCWVKADTSTTDAFFQVHEVLCADKTPATYPQRPERFIVEIETARHRFLSAVFEDGQKSVGRLYNDDFPLTVRARIFLPRSSAYGSSFVLKQALTVDALASTTAATPLTLKSPFTLWPVELKNTSGRRFFVTGRYTVPTKPYKVGANFSVPDDDPESFTPELFVDGEGRTELAVVAPASGAIDVQVNGIAAKLDGPGTYVFDGAALTKEDDVAPRPPVDPPVPTPTCGATGQAPCTGSVCAPAHRLEGSLCVACGSDGQTYCRDAGNNPVCASGHRFDSGDVKCHACGSDGQTYCRDAGGNAVCAPGHRFDSGDVKCHACGADGQTYCRDASGNATCNAGNRFDSSDAKCHVCGSDGQTYCRDASNNPLCNPGHRFDSGDAKCHVCGGEGQTYCRGANGNPACNAGLRYDAGSGTCKR